MTPTFYLEGDTLREKARMVMPDESLYCEYDPKDPCNPDGMGFDMEGYKIACSQYEQHLASLKSYPAIGFDSSFANRDLVEGFDFKFHKQTLVEGGLDHQPSWENASIMEYDTEKEPYRRLAAIPIPPEPKQEVDDQEASEDQVWCKGYEVGFKRGIVVGAKLYPKYRKLYEELSVEEREILHDKFGKDELSVEDILYWQKTFSQSNHKP